MFPLVLTMKQTTRTNKRLGEMPVLPSEMSKGLFFFTGKGEPVLEEPSYLPTSQSRWVITMSVITKQLTFIQYLSFVFCALQTASPRILIAAFWGNYCYYPHLIDEESGPYTRKLPKITHLSADSKGSAFRTYTSKNLECVLCLQALLGVLVEPNESVAAVK